MKKHSLLSIATFLFLVYSTEKTSNKYSPPGDELIGEWNNISMRIETFTKKNGTTDEVFEVDRAHWEEKLGIKPIRTFFMADRSYQSLYYNLKDSLVRKTSGTWWVKGNELVMAQQRPTADTNYFVFSVKKDTASFESMLDWDGDGRKDDKYFGQQIKVSGK